MNTVKARKTLKITQEERKALLRAIGTIEKLTGNTPKHLGKIAAMLRWA